MPARQDRQPLVDIRRRRRADGSVEEIPTVRYWDAAGKRRRLTCETTEEAGSSVSSGLDRAAAAAAATAEARASAAARNGAASSTPGPAGGCSKRLCHSSRRNSRERALPLSVEAVAQTRIDQVRRSVVGRAMPTAADIAA
jgi:hypothetical protein